MLIVNKLMYYEPFTVNLKDNIKASIDMIRLSIIVRNDMLQDLVTYFSAIRVDVDIFHSSGSYKYKYVFVIHVDDYHTATIGLCFNGNSRDDVLKGFIEFNPNKTLPKFNNDLWYVLERCTDSCIKYCDIAFDIPITRNQASLKKDSRKYEMIYNSLDDKTEYLGSRSSPGYVKLYNKTIESKLDFDLTRLEITTKPTIENLRKHFPTVNISGFDQLSINENYYKLSETQQVLIDTLNLLDPIERSRQLKRLKYETRKKILPHICGNREIVFDISPLNNIFKQLRAYEF